MKKYKGVVEKGTHRAAALGFPTVNISLGDPDVSGVYVANIVIEGKEHPAAAFADQKRKVLEAHVLDMGLDLYGKEVTIELLKKLRDSTVFESDDLLRAAIADDIQKCREYFRDV